MIYWFGDLELYTWSREFRRDGHPLATLTNKGSPSCCTSLSLTITLSPRRPCLNKVGRHVRDRGGTDPRHQADSSARVV